MAALLKLAVEGAQRLYEHGEFTLGLEMTPQERLEEYQQQSDVIKMMASELLEADANNPLLKDDVYQVYQEFARAQGRTPSGKKALTSALQSAPGLDVGTGQTRQYGDDSDLQQAYKHVSWTDVARGYMSDRIAARYFDPSDEADVSDEGDGDGGAGDETSVDTDRDEKALRSGATPVSAAAEDLTGYVDVTVNLARVQDIPGDHNGHRVVGMDASGAIDIITFDPDLAMDFIDNEDAPVIIRRARVEEYDGTRQLKLVPGVAKVESIQQGAGYTELEDSGDDARLNDTGEQAAVTDGGTTETTTTDETADADDTDVLAAIYRTVEQLDPTGDTVDSSTVAGLAMRDHGLDPGVVDDALTDLIEDGRVVDAGDGQVRIPDDAAENNDADEERVESSLTNLDERVGERISVECETDINGMMPDFHVSPNHPGSGRVTTSALGASSVQVLISEATADETVDIAPDTPVSIEDALVTTLGDSPALLIDADSTVTHQDGDAE